MIPSKLGVNCESITVHRSLWALFTTRDVNENEPVFKIPEADNRAFNIGAPPPLPPPQHTHTLLGVDHNQRGMVSSPRPVGGQPLASSNSNMPAMTTNQAMTAAPKGGDRAIVNSVTAGPICQTVVPTACRAEYCTWSLSKDLNVVRQYDYTLGK